MVFDVSVALTWLLFLALFPIGYFWLRRAWRILGKGDHSEVALRRGEPPPDAQRWAAWDGSLNLVAGLVVLFVILGIVLGVLRYDQWTAIAGTTIWTKLMIGFALSRHAHLRARRAR